MESNEMEVFKVYGVFKWLDNGHHGVIGVIVSSTPLINICPFQVEHDLVPVRTAQFIAMDQLSKEKNVLILGTAVG